jgi:thiol-disulfide isomerase/thioredoxin
MDRSHRKCPGSATVALLALGALLATSCGRPATDNRAAAGNGKPPADASTNDHASADTAPADETSDVAQPSDDAQTEVALAAQDPAPRTPEESSDQKPFAPPEPDATKAAADEPPSPFPRQIPLPPDTLDGGLAWINTGGPLELKALRGKFVLLDFWTYCCINCMHILPELKKLEAQFPNELVVIGVHSAKFETEEDSKNITDAVLRYEIEHPVVNDAKHTIWNRFGVESWPTAILIDPEGNAVYGQRGEFKAESFAALLNRALPYYRKKGTLDATPLRFDLAAYRADKTPLRFPRQGAGRRSGRSVVHRRQQSQSHHSREAGRHAARYDRLRRDRRGRRRLRRSEV